VLYIDLSVSLLFLFDPFRVEKQRFGEKSKLHANAYWRERKKEKSFPLPPSPLNRKFLTTVIYKAAPQMWFITFNSPTPPPTPSDVWIGSTHRCAAQTVQTEKGIKIFPKLSGREKEREKLGWGETSLRRGFNIIQHRALGRRYTHTHSTENFKKVYYIKDDRKKPIKIRSCFFFFSLLYTKRDKYGVGDFCNPQKKKNKKIKFLVRSPSLSFLSIIENPRQKRPNSCARNLLALDGGDMNVS
jgi:hypothetical protein